MLFVYLMIDYIKKIMVYFREYLLAKRNTSIHSCYLTLKPRIYMRTIKSSKGNEKEAEIIGDIITNKLYLCKRETDAAIATDFRILPEFRANKS